jgi:hypothetical protein
VSIEQDGFRTLYVVPGAGTYDISGRITLTPVGDGGPPEPEEPEFQWPGPDTTGVPTGTALTTVAAPVHPADTISGDTHRRVYTCRTPHAVYRGRRFPFLVQVAVPGVQFVDCEFSGVRDPGGSTALLLIRDDRPTGQPVPSASATRCTFSPDTPARAGHLFDAVRGSQFRLTGCEITGTIDGVHIFGSTQRDDPHAGHVLVESCWMHDLVVAPDPGQAATGGLSHTDAVQIVGGRNIHIVGNDLGDARMASVMLAPGTRNDRATGNILIRRNRIGVSKAGINVNDTRLPGAIEGLVIEDNEFTRQPTAIIMTARTRTVAVVTGNEWSDGSQPPPEVRPG